MPNYPKIDFEKGKTYKVELLFDECKQGVNDKGNNWYLYAVKHDGVQKSFFANDYKLHDKLRGFTKGDILEITDNDISEDTWKHSWHVVSAGSNKPLDQVMKRGINNTEIKVSTWAAMKVASSISSNIDGLKTNTWAVIELHKEICKSIENEEEMFNGEI